MKSRTHAAASLDDGPQAPLITQSRPRDASGRELDEWGLPLSGPARIAVLAETSLADPRIDPDAWAAAPAFIKPELPAAQSATDASPVDPAQEASHD